jgi:MFS family permease
MVDVLGASDAKAAMLMSIMMLPGAVGGPVIGGYLADRMGSVKLVIATGIISGLVIFGVKAFPLGFAFYAMLFIMGINMAVRMPVTEVFIMSQTPAHRRSTIYGVYYFTMQYTGAIFAPIMGVFIEKFKLLYGPEIAFETIFTFSAYAVTAVAVVTSLFYFDAKDHYEGETQVS